MNDRILDEIFRRKQIKAQGFKDGWNAALKEVENKAENDYWDFGFPTLTGNEEFKKFIDSIKELKK